MKKIILSLLVCVCFVSVPQVKAEETDKAEVLKAAAIGAAVGAGLYYVVTHKDELIEKAKELVNKIPTTETKRKGN